jgi:hypothetical protein
MIMLDKKVMCSIQYQIHMVFFDVPKGMFKIKIQKQYQ